ncbi:hypothetical protein UFOVP26_143 [uncultured Caudovirales phage]|uniref:Uncharacterized protein n=1 Tax=uncultured Caudovirales phage TaxID=2100421 RepID=A0A6J7WNK7_9CAUD|nr:hypothetical protein UFOVP26_143 [uncultured Caudovirales phage]CAB4123952.1 hypothetical protein UFOVP44_99 [uncultured Caudovirales phage]CAB5219496.1 hypothetical protein UFOVP220_90 [uncultured Caudovirales phage]
MVAVISNERISEILESSKIINTKDLGHSVVHEVIHENTPKVIVASSVGDSFKIS